MTNKKKRAISKAINGIDPVDVHIGDRLRTLRSNMGITQEQLGKALGITFQQIQKYEHGANRIAASRLYYMARRLNVPVAHFYEGMAENIASKPPGFGETGQAALEDIPEAEDGSTPGQREKFEFARLYNSIANPKLRRRICDLMRVMVGDEE